MISYSISDISQFGSRFPLRLNFWLIIGWIILLYYFSYLFEPSSEVLTISYYPLIKLYVKIAFWFVLVVSLLSTITVLFGFLSFQFGKKNKYRYILESGVRGVKNGYIKGDIPAHLKPLLGKLQAIVWYDKQGQRPTFIHKIPIGHFSMELPITHIRIYTVREMDLLFLDFLRMYRIPAALYSVNTFTKEPKEQIIEPILHKSKIYNQADSNSDQLQYHPGEWLQFKPYESGDNLRRIIWKLYAKNKSLYVRHQERYTYEDSKIKLVAFFEMDEYFYKYVNAELLQFLLDKYKTSIYSIYKVLRKNHKDVELSIHQGLKASSDLEVKSLLSSADWITSFPHIELPDRSHIITHTFIPEPIIKQIEDKSSHEVHIIKLVADLEIKEADKWWWSWLFNKRPRRYHDMQNYLPSQRALAQLKREEADRISPITMQ